MPAVEMKASEVLSRAADLIEPEGAWTQGAFWRLADGITQEDIAGEDPPEDPKCFCLYGALAAVQGEYVDPDSTPIDPYQRFITRALGLPGSAYPARVIEWNDADGRTQAEVVSALRQASELARSEGN